MRATQQINFLAGVALVLSGIVIIDIPSVYGLGGLIAPGLGEAMIVIGALFIGFFLQSRGWHK